MEEISKSSIYEAADWLAKKYREELLTSPKAEEARWFVNSLGITPSIAEELQIGFSTLDYVVLCEWAAKANINILALESCALEKRGQYCDEGCVVFPIRDVQDRTVAFHNVLLPKKQLYVNSLENPLFSPERVLYGLDRARHAIRKTGTAIVVESVADHVFLVQKGFDETVALCSKIGAEQVRILKRFANKIILVVESDAASLLRAKESIRFFVEQGVDMSVLTLPQKYSLCVYLTEKGSETFRRALTEDVDDVFDFAFKMETKDVDLENDAVESAKALDSLLETLALYPAESRSSRDPSRLRMIDAVQRYATRFHTTEDELLRQIAEKRELRINLARETV